MNAKMAANTVKGYGSAWRCFERWCAEHDQVSLPATPQLCIDYSAWLLANGYRYLTVENRLKAINYHHRERKTAAPFNDAVSEFLRNARRDLCERPQGKLALSPAQLRRVSKLLKQRNRLTDIRDRAMILLCFASGWRRAEIRSLDFRDVQWVPQGITLWLGKSKTDQEGEGRLVGIQYGRRELTCPLLALEEWLDVRGSWDGPLFTSLNSRKNIFTERRLHDDALRRALKSALAKVGENPKPFGAHSLRAGMITASAEAGATETSIMQRTGHKCYETLRRYVRPATVFRANPLRRVL